MNKSLISIILPVYNEEKNIPILLDKITESVSNFKHEIIAVNDGSKDKSWEVLVELSRKNKGLKLINFRKNFGQTAAINAGIQFSNGDIIILIDSDLENDPADIPQMLKKIDEGFDVVSGWRKNRWGKQFLSRKLPSLLANKLISYISGVKLHDYGCTLKAYKRDVIEGVRLYGQMHRFIPIFCVWQGGKVTEMPVNYKPRIYGKSNYGLFRIYKVMLDLILIKFLDKFMNRPIHFFGGLGFLSLFASFLSFCAALYLKIKTMADFIETPLPTISVTFFIVGILMMLLGVLAEILMRTYYESQGQYPFTVKDKVNF